jgi:hypothetical protein
MVLVGPRGMGKTVLLAEIASRAAERYGWPPLAVEAPLSGHLSPSLSRRAEGVKRLLSEQPEGAGLRLTEAVVRANVLGVGGEVHLSRTEAAQAGPSLTVEESLALLIDEANRRSTGVVLTVDEAHAGTREDLGELGAAIQHATGANWPIVVVIAGLPSLQANRLPSYFERADWHDVSSLTLRAALDALTGPAENAGRPFEDGAAQHLVDQTGGYPYAVQVYGHAAWRASHGQDLITKTVVDKAIPAATAELERSLFAQRWQQASPREREYLVALAEQSETGGPATGAAVAGRLGKTTYQLAQHRNRLITKGTLVAQGEHLSFVVPGLGNYILRQAHDRAG